MTIALRRLLHRFALPALALAMWSACGVDQPPPSDAIDRASPAPATAQPTQSPGPADATRTAVRPRRTGPFLRIEDTFWDWGVATAGQELRHIFVLHNDGDETVRIKKVRPT